MDTTEIFMNTPAEYRIATDQFMDYTELFTQPTENAVSLGLPEHFLRISIQQSEDTRASHIQLQAPVLSLVLGVQGPQPWRPCAARTPPEN